MKLQIGRYTRITPHFIVSFTVHRVACRPILNSYRIFETGNHLFRLAQVLTSLEPLDYLIVSFLPGISEVPGILNIYRSWKFHTEWGPEKLFLMCPGNPVPRCLAANIRNQLGKHHGCGCLVRSFASGQWSKVLIHYLVVGILAEQIWTLTVKSLIICLFLLCCQGNVRRLGIWLRDHDLVEHVGASPFPLAKQSSWWDHLALKAGTIPEVDNFNSCPAIV